MSFFDFKKVKAQAAEARKFVGLAEQLAQACETFGADVEAGRVSIVLGKSGITLMRHVLTEDEQKKNATLSEKRRTPKTGK